MDDSRIPIVVGVGQHTNRLRDVAESLDPFALIKIAAQKAEEDTGARAFLNQVDSVKVANIICWRYPDIASMVAEAIGASPHDREYTSIGGNTPQMLVNKVASQIYAGEIRLALICGAEAMYSRRLARKTGQRLPWPELPTASSDSAEARAEGSGLIEAVHGMLLPIHAFPLFENALRTEEGGSIEENIDQSGELWARFAQVAKDNPYAWFRDGKSKEEIVTVTPVNRMICFPYPKFMNSLLDVDQGAAAVITSVEMAKRLGIPEEKWVYIWGCGDCNDIWSPIDKVNFSSAPGIRTAAQQALDHAGLDIEQIDRYDLYSCFPVVPKMAKKMMGIPERHGLDLTLTGGLSFFGGPGNNYSLHALCSAVELLRKDREKLVLLYALGWYFTKHSVGIYSGVPKEGDFGQTDEEKDQRETTSVTGPETAAEPEGPCTIETFTVVHDNEGKPSAAIIVGRLPDDRRFFANTEPDQELFEHLMTEDVIGQKGRVKPKVDGQRNVFSL